MRIDDDVLPITQKQVVRSQQMLNLSIQKRVQCTSEYIKTFTKARVYTQNIVTQKHHNLYFKKLVILDTQESNKFIYFPDKCKRRRFMRVFICK